MDNQQLEMVLEADFLGRGQNLTPDVAQDRLQRSLDARAEAVIREGDDPQLDSYWRYFGYRSIAYDASGLTTTLMREYPDSNYKIVDAHMALMRSMILNAPEPDVQPLLDVVAELRSR